MSVPVTYSVEKMTLKKLLNMLTHQHKVCGGIPSDQYQEIECSLANTYVSSYNCHNGSRVNASVLRSKVCSGMVDMKSKTCLQCISLQSMLAKKLIESQKPVHRNMPITSLPKSKLVEEVKTQRHNVKKLKLKTVQLEKEIKKVGVALSTEMSDGLSKILNSSDLSSHPNELLRLFWEQQQVALTRDPRGMRWHPMMIRFAIYLHYQSPRAYKALRDTGVLRLPNQSTLRDYSNYIQPKSGFQLHVFEVRTIFYFELN